MNYGLRSFPVLSPRLGMKRFRKRNASAIKPKVVLVADDDADEVIFLQQALELSGLSQIIQLQFVSHGGAAIDYLSGKPPFDDRNQAAIPDLVLLDLKMPGIDGFEVLNWVRSAPKFVRLPVIVRSASMVETDRERAMRLGANAFYIKKIGFLGDVTLLMDVAEQWLGVKKRISSQGRLLERLRKES